MSQRSLAPFKWLWITVAVILIDYLTKQWANHSLEYADPQQVLPIFDLTLLYNTGAAFSFLANQDGWQRWFFAVIAFAVSGMLLHWLSMLKPNQRWLGIALTLILGGAIGNLYDRLVYGYVIDFLHFHWQQHYFPAFNIADTAITIGAIMLIIDAIWLQPKEGSNHDLMDHSSQDHTRDKH